MIHKAKCSTKHGKSKSDSLRLKSEVADKDTIIDSLANVESKSHVSTFHIYCTVLIFTVFLREPSLLSVLKRKQEVVCELNLTTPQRRLRRLGLLARRNTG